MAALPDLIAKEVMFAITSGRASKIMRSTPMGQVLRSRINPSSSLVFNVVLLTNQVRSCRSRAPQYPDLRLVAGLLR